MNTKKNFFIMTLAITLIVISACGPAETVETEIPTQDPVIITSIAETAQAGVFATLTQSVLDLPTEMPTPFATFTPENTATLLPSAVHAEGVSVIPAGKAPLTVFIKSAIPSLFISPDKGKPPSLPITRQIAASLNAPSTPVTSLELKRSRNALTVSLLCTVLIELPEYQQPDHPNCVGY